MKKCLFILFPLLLAGCAQRELPQQPGDEPITISKHVVPEVVNPGGSYFVAVRLLGGARVDSVRLDVFAAGQSNPFATYALFDDGGNLYPNDGDQVAFDGYFCQNIVWAAGGGGQQNYTWSFSATDSKGQSGQPLTATVSSQRNSAPVLLRVETPDSLPSGFDGELLFRIEVADSNGLADVDKVSYDAFKDGVLNFQVDLEPEGAGLFVAKMNKLFAIGKNGLYELRFKATDKSGGQSAIFSKNVFIGNNAPQLVEFVHVDSVQMPSAGFMSAFLITVRVEDDQTLLDVNEVKLEWKKPDGTFSANSPFTLFDNGLPWNEDFTGWDDGWRGDVTADDGVFSITGIFDPNQPLGDYELTFYARDFSGNASARVTRIVTLYPREGV